MTAIVPAQAANPAPIEGKWRKGNMEVEIRPCADAWCATVTDASESQRAKARKGSGVELLGLTMIRDLRPDKKPGRYKGRVFIADRDMTVKGTVTVINDQRIKVRGCAVIGLICREREWVRTGR
ncbi:DUF2147 domain-containing protein [Sphingomicrobium clamense]|uniref:DUF2147 domain-containing protein n=1 Tax=Sphingomicrobium clamense TaxID=2851013 RepID=A0ABS6V2M9_9SPHN|nr:DUF2147 domain-containing protein [Sphingomicrobium sp. B8]MBW0143807.1 DUF2147 domain-containing protein [Sphingomicrobium sp. B8]